MRHWRIWLFVVAMIGIFGLCIYSGMPPGTSILPAPPRAEVIPPAATQAEPAAPATQAAQVTVEATGTATEAPTDVPQETEVAAAEVDYCVECHTDKQQLIDTAAPEEVVVEESEGAG